MRPDPKKIIEYFNGLNDRARYAILAGVVLVIILLDVFVLLLPQLSAIAHVSGRIEELSRDTREVLTDKQRIVQLQRNLEEERDSLKSLNSKVRLVAEVPAILSTISSIANEYGVVIDQLSPERSQQEVLATASEGKYYGLPVEIKARCGYHRFGYFLNKLENEDMYFIMKDFIIQNDAKDPNTHLFSMTIKLILLDPGAQGAASKSL